MSEMVPRRTREQRAYRLAVTGGTLAVAAVVGFVLAVVGVIGIGLPLILALVAGACAFMFRQTVSPKR